MAAIRMLDWLSGYRSDWLRPEYESLPPSLHLS